MPDDYDVAIAQAKARARKAPPPSTGDDYEQAVSQAKAKQPPAAAPLPGIVPGGVNLAPLQGSAPPKSPAAPTQSAQAKDLRLQDTSLQGLLKTARTVPQTGGLWDNSGPMQPKRTNGFVGPPAPPDKSRQQEEAKLGFTLKDLHGAVDNNLSTVPMMPGQLYKGQAAMPLSDAIARLAKVRGTSTTEIARLLAGNTGQGSAAQGSEGLEMKSAAFTDPRLAKGNLQDPAGIWDAGLGRLEDLLMQKLTPAIGVHPDSPAGKFMRGAADTAFRFLDPHGQAAFLVGAAADPLGTAKDIVAGAAPLLSKDATPEERGRALANVLPLVLPLLFHGVPALKNLVAVGDRPGAFQAAIDHLGLDPNQAAAARDWITTSAGKDWMAHWEAAPNFDVSQFKAEAPKADAGSRPAPTDHAAETTPPVVADTPAKTPQMESAPGQSAGQSAASRPATTGAAATGPATAEPPKTAAEQVMEQKRQQSAQESGGAQSGATGLANQVQEREALQGIIDQVEPTKGKGAQHWQEEGKKAVEEGPRLDPEADYEDLARRVAAGEVELTGKRVGILLEGKRQLMREVQLGETRLQADPNNDFAARELEKSRARLSEYLDNVQSGKGRWSDVGRALQAGTKLDTGDFAQVLQRLKEVNPNHSGASAKTLKALADQIGAPDETGQYPEGTLNRRIADLMAENERLRTESGGRTSRVGRRTYTKEDAQAEIQQILDDWKKAAPLGAVHANPIGAVLKVSAETVKAAGQIAHVYMKLGASSLEEVVTRTLQHFADLPEDQKPTRQMIIDELGKTGATRTKDELQQRIAALKAEARRNTTEARARMLDRAKSAVERKALAEQWKREEAVFTHKEEIADLERQIAEGRYRIKPPREKQVDQELADLQAEKRALSNKIEQHLAAEEKGAALKAVLGTANAVRGTILGTDLGQLTRQGLFGVVRPKAYGRGLIAGYRALRSEAGLAKAEMAIEDREIGGRRAAPIRRRAGLSLTDSMTHPEELVIARFFEKIPGLRRLLGKPLERAQLAFINTLRAELFDSGIAAGFSDRELATRARFINAATGRGNVRSVPALAQLVFTSPRYEASRWQTLWESVRSPGDVVAGLYKGEGLNRGALRNIQDMAATATAALLVFKAAEAAGYKVTWDPASPDFLKMRRGNEVWDISAGLAPRLRDLLRLASAIQDPKYGSSLKDIWASSTTRMFSPTVRTPIEQIGYAIQRAHGVDEPRSVITGMKAGEGDEGLVTFSPLIFQSAKQAWDDEGPTAAFEAFLKELAGSGVSRYPEKKPK